MLKDDDRLNVVLCLHMHQPEYRDLETGEYQLPWTYLHAIKDYVDIASHLEATPHARAVINFSPILVVQLHDYASQLKSFQSDGTSITDALLAALAVRSMPSNVGQRQALIGACLRANVQRMVERFPAYKALTEIAVEMNTPARVGYVNDQFLTDLLVWYHLVWLGETVRRTDLSVRRLIEKGENFDYEDKRELLALIERLLESIIPRYAALARAGKVELSMSPYGHPIVPLLLNLESARESMPDATLPAAERYPGGRDSALGHLRRGIEVFRTHFGLTPSGCWPSEGALSTATLELLSETGFTWAASGEGVLSNSLRDAGFEPGGANLFHAYRVGETSTKCFFRDEAISDAIGFSYQEWHADDAVADLINRLKDIRASREACAQNVVSIVLDGENAWEHYPENAYYFLSALFEKLSSEPGLRLTTFDDCLKHSVSEFALPALVAGSWVYGTLSTWIGERSKNLAWDYLCEAKREVDAVLAAGRLQAPVVEELRRQLDVCEGSDWFWWLGDVNPSESVALFDSLFRRHLRRLYKLMAVKAPSHLDESLSLHAQGSDSVGVMRRSSAPHD